MATHIREAVIVEAVRTPVGRRNGALKDWHAVDLLAHVLEALVERSGIHPARIDDVIAGCVTQVGEQSCNIARNAVLAAGFPESVPGTTIDRQCGSSQQAAHFAAQGVISGAYDIAVACGVEAMTRVPMGSNTQAGGTPFGPKMRDRYHGAPFNQGLGAETIAERWGLGREELDAFALRSHERAAQARAVGRFAQQIVPVPITVEGGNAAMFGNDEGIRSDTSIEKLAGLKPAFREDGRVTAGNSSQISDGASAVLVVERRVAEQLGLRPRARFVAFALAGDDPVVMLTAPIPATRKILETSGIDLDAIDRAEINEAFASVVLAWQRELNVHPDRVNVNGGAIALGHPLGASGTRLLTDLLVELERSSGRYGLQTMCEGGGLANATIIERLD
jgi:acetyl-CoA acyltransferase